MQLPDVSNKSRLCSTRTCSLIPPLPLHNARCALFLVVWPGQQVVCRANLSYTCIPHPAVAAVTTPANKITVSKRYAHNRSLMTYVQDTSYSIHVCTFFGYDDYTLCGGAVQAHRSINSIKDPSPSSLPGKADARTRELGVPVGEHPCTSDEEAKQPDRCLGHVCKEGCSVMSGRFS